jgi:hypothetical protein
LAIAENESPEMLHFIAANHDAADLDTGRTCFP